MSAAWTERARNDALEYAAHISEDKPGAAAKWLETISDKADMAALFPTSGRVVPEFGSEHLREVFAASHRIVYRVLEESVEVLRVFHGARVLKQSDVNEE